VPFGWYVRPGPGAYGLGPADRGAMVGEVVVGGGRLVVGVMNGVDTLVPFSALDCRSNNTSDIRLIYTELSRRLIAIYIKA